METPGPGTGPADPMGPQSPTPGLPTPAPGSTPGQPTPGNPDPVTTGRSWLPACASIGPVCAAEPFGETTAAPYQLRSRSDGLYFREGDRIQRRDSTGSFTTIRTHAGLVFFDADFDDTLVHSTNDPPGLFRGPISTGAQDVELSVPSEAFFYGFALTATDTWLGTSIDTVRIPRDGSPPTTVSSVACIDLVADDRWVFCRSTSATGSGLGRIDLASAVAETVTDVPILGDVEVTPAYAYLAPDFASDPNVTMTLYRVVKDPVSLTTLEFGTVANTFATDAGGVYFTVYEASDGVSVFYLPDDATDPVPVAQGIGNAPMNGSTGIDETHVYFSRVNEEGTYGEIFRAPRCGCP